MENKSVFADYLKEKAPVIIVYITIYAIFTAALLLQHISLSKIVYPLCVVIFLSVLYFIWNYLYYRKRVVELRRVRENMDDNLPELPKNYNMYESEYQEIIKKLWNIKSEQINIMKDQSESHREHVTMWAHQIKTPITALNLICERIEGEERNEIKGRLFEIEGYVDTMMQFTRMDSLNSDLVIRKTSLDDVVNTSVIYFKRIFIGRRISLKKGSLSGVVTTDDKWLIFAVKQLLSNALKYSQDGSAIEIYEEEDENNIYLVIKDFGIGIDSADIPRLFERGFTGYNGHKDRKATGMGLFLTKEILIKLGHTIKIESEIGKGTKAIIEFSKFDIS